MRLREDLKSGDRTIKEIMVFDDDELTEEKVSERAREVIECIDEIERLYKRLTQLRAKRDAIPRTRRPRDFRRYSWAVARHRLLISKLFRSIQFTHGERKLLIEEIQRASEEMRPLERELNKTEKKVEGSRSNGNKDLRKDLRQLRQRLDRFRGPVAILRR